MKKKFKRELTALDGIFGFVEDFTTTNRVGEDVTFSVKLAVEELFTNLLKHNTGGSDHIDIDLSREENKLVIVLKDFDVEPFDITQTKPVDIHQPLDERMIGGLGIHLVKSIVDKLTYEYKDRILCVTAIKNLEGKDV